MEQVARTVYLSAETDSELVGLSEQSKALTSEIIRECVLIGLKEGIVRDALLRRLEEMRRRQEEETTRELRTKIARGDLPDNFWRGTI